MHRAHRIQARPHPLPHGIGYGRGSWGAKRRRCRGSSRLELALSSLYCPGSSPYPFPYRHMTHERTTLIKQGFTAVAASLPGPRPGVALPAVDVGEEEPNLDTAAGAEVLGRASLLGLSWMNRYKATDHSRGEPVTRTACTTSVRSSQSAALATTSRAPIQPGQARHSRQALAVDPDSTRTSASPRVTQPTCLWMTIRVDYIFVDPPFGENIYYADLAQMIEAWHRRPDPGRARGDRGREQAGTEGHRRLCGADG